MARWLSWLFKAEEEAETASSQAVDEYAQDVDTDSSKFVNVEGSELLEAVEDFVQGTVRMKQERDDLAVSMHRDAQRRLRSLHCIDELLRECDLESETAAHLTRLKDDIKLQQHDPEKIQIEVSELDEELTMARDACAEGIKLMHKLLVTLYEPLPQSEALDDTLHPADVNVAFSAAEGERMTMGILDKVFSAGKPEPAFSVSNVVPLVLGREAYLPTHRGMYDAPACATLNCGGLNMTPLDDGWRSM